VASGWTEFDDSYNKISFSHKGTIFILNRKNDLRHQRLLLRSAMLKARTTHIQRILCVGLHFLDERAWPVGSSCVVYMNQVLYEDVLRAGGWMKGIPVEKPQRIWEEVIKDRLRTAVCIGFVDSKRQILKGRNVQVSVLRVAYFRKTQSAIRRLGTVSKVSLS
jgi:hypothetical protein